MHIAIIGCGEVGRCYAAAFSELPDLTLSLCDIQPSQGMQDLASPVNAPLYTEAGDWLHAADVVLVCVQGFAALEANRSIIRHTRPGVIIADSTTASPEHKRQAALEAQARQIDLVDVAIMGLVAGTGVRTPLLLAGAGSGPVGALLTRMGAPVRILDQASAGDAISLKLLRSILTKGLETLAVEALVAAEQRGVRPELYALLGDIDQVPIITYLETLVRTHVIHARRRQHEMEDAQEQLQQAGLPSQVLPGVVAVFAQTGALLEEHPISNPAPTASEAIAWLLRNKGKTSR